MEKELNDVNEVSTQTDDTSSSGPTEQELLDAVMQNSDFLKNEESIPLPEKETGEVDPEESSEVEDPVEEEAVSEEAEEEQVEEEEVEGEDDTSTQEPDTYELDELDDFTINLKIDGEVTPVKLSDMAKGFATEQSLSKKGRELGEARKALDTEREEKLKELTDVSHAAAGMLMQGEQAFAKEFHDLEAKIKKAREDGDTFELGELKDKKDVAQQKYWEARKQREGMISQVQKFQEEQANKAWQDQLDYFHKEIPNLIPDFNEDTAKDIREFALNDLKLSAETLNGIADPRIVWALNDYRLLKNNVAKGIAKRKVIPAKKAIPTKKAKTPQRRNRNPLYNPI